MIDLRPRFDEAVRRIRAWRTRYSVEEYPHKIVLNIMYRAYGMDYIWGEFKSGKLPQLSSIEEAFNWMDNHYAEITGEKIQPYLLDWLKTNPNKEIGNVVFEKYEALARKAELDKNKKEELEFSYLYHLLEDYCVLYFIGFRLLGKSTVDVISMMTNYLIEDMPQMNYGMAKQVFSQLYVNRYMHEHYSPLP